MKKRESYLAKVDKNKFNPYQFQHHYLSFKDWINQSFTVITDDVGHPLYKKMVVDLETGRNTIEVKKLKRKCELWMLVLTTLIDFNIAVDKKAVIAGKKPEPFVFYGTHKVIRNHILNLAREEIRASLACSITMKQISTALSRLKDSGFITIEYDHSVTPLNRQSGKHYRSIKLNYAKIAELSSEFNLSNKRTKTWLKYERCSREHRWISKRPISALSPLIEELADKQKKEEYKEKLKELKLKLRGAQDIFKAYVLKKQKFYNPNENIHKKLAGIKSEEDLFKTMLEPPDIVMDDKQHLTDHQRYLLASFYSNID